MESVMVPVLKIAGLSAALSAGVVSLLPDAGDMAASPKAYRERLGGNEAGAPAGPAVEVWRGAKGTRLAAASDQAPCGTAFPCTVLVRQGEGSTTAVLVRQTPFGIASR
jgi:hypothetical protein